MWFPTATMLWCNKHKWLRIFLSDSYLFFFSFTWVYIWVISLLPISTLIQNIDLTKLSIMLQFFKLCWIMTNKSTYLVALPVLKKLEISNTRFCWYWSQSWTVNAFLLDTRYCTLLLFFSGSANVLLFASKHACWKKHLYFVSSYWRFLY